MNIKKTAYKPLLKLQPKLITVLKFIQSKGDLYPTDLQDYVL